MALKVHTGFRDGHPRVKDLELAEHLGYARVRDVRALIRSVTQGKFLEMKKLLHAPGQPGRPGVEYWLTYEQAKRICARSGAPKAMETMEFLGTLFEHKLPIIPAVKSREYTSTASSDTSVPHAEDYIKKPDVVVEHTAVIDTHDLDVIARLKRIEALLSGPNLSCSVPDDVARKIMRKFPDPNVRDAWVLHALEEAWKRTR